MPGRFVSEFGRYEGYSSPLFDRFERRSCYVAMRDGVRLAVDFFVPAKIGTEGAFPAILQLTPYNRANIVEGELVHALSPYPANGRRYSNNLAELCRHGYVIVAADVRGQGASFGSFTGCMTAEEGRDAADLVAWIRAQPWCSGAVGMLGSSYGGQTQFLAAAERPPGLRALFPCHSLFDAYDIFFPGGARNTALPRVWGAMVDALAGRTAPSTVAPVDGPDGPDLLVAAVAEHRRSSGADEVFREIYAEPTRDGTGYFVRSTSAGSQNLAPLLPRLHEAGIPAYHWGGWNDYYPADAIRWFLNWKGAPAKLALGPWSHSPRSFTSLRDEEDLRLRAVESLRWFDCWLKGIDNGVLDEPPLHYALQTGHPYHAGPSAVSADAWEWRSSRGWPIDGTTIRTWWFATAPATGEGQLCEGAPTAVHRRKLVVDSSVGTGEQNRLVSSLRLLPQQLPEMSALDARCLSWTTEVLHEDVVLAGTPVVTLQATADVPDALFVLWLEDVDAVGRSTLISYGSLKASHRALGQAPYETGGGPWHPSTVAAVAATRPLDAELAQLEIALLPVANRFPAGHRIRLTLSGSDRDQLEEIAPGATLWVHSAPTCPSSIDLPLLDPSRSEPIKCSP